VRATPAAADDAAFLAACVHNQAKRVRIELIERSAIIGKAVRDRRVDIVSAVYDLRSGQVQRLD
jgi:carbonic anhydrase